MTEPRHGPLRVAAVLDSLVVPAWIDRALAEFERAEFVEVVLVIVLRRRPEPPVSASARQPRTPGHLLYDLYRRLDARGFRTGDDAFRRRDTSNRFTCEVLELSPDDLERPEQFERLRDLRLDVLLRFGPDDLGQGSAAVARYGLWSFPTCDDSGQGFFRTIAREDHVASTALELRTAGGERRVVYRSFSATDLLSLHRTRNDAHWKASSFALRALRALPDLREQEAEETTGNERLTGGYPSSLELSRFVAGLGGRMARRKARSLLFDEQWFIAYRRRRDGAPPADMSGFTLVLPPTDRFYADPFLIRGPDGRHHVFFEDFRNADGKALISRSELLPDGTISPPQVVLEQDYHLSYPFVFEWEGEIYLLPESARSRRLELYRAVDFPDRWEPHRVLMDEAVFDATLFPHDGKLWLFTNLATSDGKPTDELSIFWANSLEGRWHAHALNPVVSDVRWGRPAGRLIVQDGRLIRPAQDGSVRYGYALVFREIVELSPETFQEVHLTTITPDWLRGNLCTHHYDADSTFEVVDGRLLIPKWRSRKTDTLVAASTR